MSIGNLITATRVKWGLKIIKRSKRNVSKTCALFLAVVMAQIVGRAVAFAPRSLCTIEIQIWDI